MARGNHFSINEFAEFSRTTRETLRHYDRIGLLRPESRGENNYRYYSTAQLAVVNVIRTFQESGMTLDEIKRNNDIRLPEQTEEAFSHQVEKIDAIIEKWIQARKLLYTLQKVIRSAMNVNEEEITVQFMPAEAIILGGLNDYSRGRNDYDALFSFYQYMHEKFPDLDMNYPVWGVFSQERIKQGDWVWPDRYYFYNPEGYDKKPAGQYVVGYMRGGYGHGDALYRRILDYIDKNGFEICGDAYEEYPLNEICITEENNYLIRVMIMVREKGSVARSV
ncbi:MAG: MerR family transcriptional regulator [Clostridia bacterium]|nr:MerR family transcriptional regulator [Clostridia bacterium]